MLSEFSPQNSRENLLKLEVSKMNSVLAKSSRQEDLNGAKIHRAKDDAKTLVCHTKRSRRIS